MGACDDPKPSERDIRESAALGQPRPFRAFEKERDMTKRVMVRAGLALSLLVLPAASDAQSGVTLYEISERVTFDPESLDGSVVIFRDATSPLLGFAALGTPLCPSELLVTVPGMERCTVSATGTDAISTLTGLGPVHGTFDVIINAPGNSTVHVPDLPVITGTFDGAVDLSLAVLSQVPLGSITGNFTITQTADAGGTLMPVTPVVLPFTGTFRLPFGLDPALALERCDRENAAFYLADDLITLLQVRDNERSVGFPTVRLELTFP
jgi:hypothetical protein